MIQQRLFVLLRFPNLLERHCNEIAVLETWDSGKKYEHAANIEIPMVIRLFRYYAGKESERKRRKERKEGDSILASVLFMYCSILALVG